MIRSKIFNMCCLAALMLGLSACASMPPPEISRAVSALPATPSVGANKTVLDEQAALSVELAYQASALTLRTGLRAGLIKGPDAVRAAKADQTAYSAVKAMRAAYDAGNARSYVSAVLSAREAITRSLTLLKGDSS
jgi:hypothetical protein